MVKICLCPSSINWIRRHLKKSAKKAFSSMLKRNINVITQSLVSVKITKRKKGKSKTKGRGKRGKSSKQTSQQAKFRAAAKKCKGKGKGFRPCMKRELKRKR